MNFSSLLAFLTLSLLASLVGAQITVGYLITGPAPSLSQGALLTPPTRSLFVKKCMEIRQYRTYGDLPFGPYINGNGVLTVLQTYGIPDRASIDEPLNVFTGPDVDLGIWFTISQLSLL
ncbi:hypothetical protein ONZ45_g13082 [Pleurotus djamor]|nr:hypothetical protein ONZ45_g13082 [Pleurotus djamor]